MLYRSAQSQAMDDPLRPPRVEQLPAQIGRDASARAPSAVQERVASKKRAAAAKTARSRAPRSLRIVPWIIGLAILLSFGLPVYFLFPLLRDAYRQHGLRETGISAPAEIIAVSETNTTFNEQPVLDLTLRVLRSDGVAYETNVSQGFSMLHAPNLRPGGGVTVKYDAGDPTITVVVETGTRSPFTPTTQQLPSPRPSALAPAPSATSSAIPSSPVHDLAAPAPAVCAQTYSCCLTVVGTQNAASCGTFRDPNFPAFGCQTALQSFQQAARAQGRSCEN